MFQCLLESTDDKVEGHDRMSTESQVSEIRSHILISHELAHTKVTALKSVTFTPTKQVSETVIRKDLRNKEARVCGSPGKR